MAIVNLITCNSEIEATHLKNILFNEGVESYLTNVNLTNLAYGYIGNQGVQVMIDEKDTVTALEVISRLGYFNELACPICHSKNISLRLGDKKFRKVILIILSMVSFIPFANFRKTYYCKDCNAKFTK